MAKLFRKDPGSAQPAVQLTTSATHKTAMDWSRDGQYVLYVDRAPATNEDVWVVPLDGKSQPFALAALATTVAIREGVRDAPPNDPAAGARFTAITDWEGTEAAADISPDGRFVTFLADRDGQFDLWWTQIGTGRFSKLTPLPPGPAAQRRPSDILKTFGFSGEGADI